MERVFLAPLLAILPPLIKSIPICDNYESCKYYLINKIIAVVGKTRGARSIVCVFSRE